MPTAHRGGCVPGSVVIGVEAITYDLPALDAGSFVFVCEVHLYMHGVFRVR